MVTMFDDNDAALVFFDWLSRFTESDQFEGLSRAERRVFWDLEATLESALTEVVDQDYVESVDAASARLTAREDDKSE